MIVLDASILVSAVIRKGSLPDQVTRRAFQTDRVAVSAASLAELNDVLARPHLARFIDPALRDEVLALLNTRAALFDPSVSIRECRDPNDDEYLKLALAAGAEAIITGDADLLVLHPWRGISILRPADHLAGSTRRG